MAFFITVEIRNLTNILVLILLLVFLLDLHCIGGASRGLFFISPFLVLFLFFFLAGLLKKLAGLGPRRGRSCFFSLRLLQVGVFDSYSLGLHL